MDRVVNRKLGVTKNDPLLPRCCPGKSGLKSQAEPTGFDLSLGAGSGFHAMAVIIGSVRFQNVDWIKADSSRRVEEFAYTGRQSIP